MGQQHGENGHAHQHHGGAGGFVFEFLDGVMLACFIVVCGLLAELAWRELRASRVRYDLTPEGRAATDRPAQPAASPDAPSGQQEE